MAALLAISWFVWLIGSVVCIFHFIGFSGLTAMFPEGRRSWHFPIQLLTLVNFALVVKFDPF